MPETENSLSTPVIFLMGPTASGKTAVAVDLVNALPTDIISVDSAMVYRGMDIGTAKPSAEIQKIAPHRLIDICDPVESYSAGHFVHDALIEIDEIQSNQRIPLLVGGTGLYFRSLQQGFSRLPTADTAIRSRLEAEAQEKGWNYMYKRLLDVDPGSSARIHPNDPQRIQRALEIYEITGKPASDLYARGRMISLDYPVIKIILAPENREQLHATIESRFMQMIEAGLLDEVKQLQERGDLGPALPSMRLVGYRQVCLYLNGDISYNDMIKKGIASTRQLARRQLTWLRSEKNALWVDSNKSEISHFLLNYLQSHSLMSTRL